MPKCNILLNFEIKKAIRHLHSILRPKLQEQGLYIGQTPVLICLGKPRSQKELANMTIVSAAAMTTTVKRMEKEQLITVTKCERDARENIVELTEKGEKCANVVTGIFSYIDDICFEGFNSKEKVEFLSYVDRIVNNAKNYDIYSESKIQQMEE